MILKAMQPRMSACEAFVERPAAPSVQQRERTTTSQKERKPKKMRQSNARVIGLDVHPDSFAGAILEGSDAGSARVLSTSTRVALPGLEQWAERHTRREDLLVLEASGNAFAVAQRLRRIKRRVEILDRSPGGKSGSGLLRQ
jgi:hypothetical protein